ncbi:threonine--tRNA ligase [Candidatus Sumerlaeota bacterium]|nr:threonine--tRNA ligase [Candidatus Sumerlaeota bacterium]
MPLELQFPDGSKRSYEDGATFLQVAESISAGLARNALGAMLDDQPMDLNAQVPHAGTVRILTFNDAEGRDIFRHTSTHIMALATQRVLPGTKLATGPALDDGYFYDMETPRPVTTEDLAAIEAEMQKIVKEDQPIMREEMPRDKAIQLFNEMGEHFKVELMQAKMAEAETVSVYRHGDFVDLCRGPHLPRTGLVKAFKLTGVAGAYWLGDQNNQQLQRVYGTSFPKQKDLDEYLRLIEEAKKRDHRKIGRELDLFSFHDEGPGFPFFHNKGTIVWNLLMDAMRTELRKLDYQEIKTPQILSEDLWHQSGHWDNYKENMYFTKIDERDFAVKPMNCPGGLLVYRSGLHSYRELPMKVAEFGHVHRHELSGVLHGLFRVRCFTQDDAHVFCTEEQIEDSVIECIDLMRRFYSMFGFDDVHIELSTKPAKAIGSDEIWDKATKALEQALNHLEIDFQLNPGDGAFYGPKIDFHIKDCLNRSWQCGTIQLDFSMPERFDLTYVGPDGEKHRPVMLHRAIFGSIERFLGILIEHCEGNFPLWLAPLQVRVLPMNDELVGKARETVNALKEAGIRAELDESDNKLGAKIRDAEMQKVPAMFIIGRREAESGQVAVRRHGAGDQGAMALDAAIAALQEEIETKNR